MTGPDHAPSWRASGSVDPGWAPPATTPPSGEPEAAGPRARRRPPVWVLVVGPLVALALLVGLTVGLGGFGQRKDRRHDVAVGTPITTGPYLFTITRATSQLRDSLGEQKYRVIVYGTVANTSHAGSFPDTGQFFGKDLDDPAVARCDLVSVGDNTDATVGNTVTPGLPPVTLRLEFEFDRTWKPSSTFRIAIADLTEVDRTFGGKDPHVEPDPNVVYRVDLPMAALAAQH